MEHERITGWGADVDARDRPGVPMERPPGGPTSPPSRQESDVEVLRSASVFGMPPVYGTAVPPRGLSGVLRRAAYRIPEHKARRWMLLLVADRVDVVEGALEDTGRGPLRLLGLAAVGSALVLFARRRRVRRARPRGRRLLGR